MRFFATVLLAMSFCLNSIVGVLGTLVVCIHDDLVHVDAIKAACCQPGHNFEHGKAPGEKVSCSDASDCVDLVIGDGSLYKLGSERLKLPLPQLVAQVLREFEISEPLDKRNFVCIDVAPASVPDNLRVCGKLPLII